MNIVMMTTTIIWWSIFFVFIEKIATLCISTSTLGESIIKSSPSLCFNETNDNDDDDSNIFQSSFGAIINR
ncbi:hypothetical protein DERF_013706 [Dermatophagoides farinae]|uniref:Uncharacterized protein n=1 Tax=Dermatophagoides farinae TaxID=6954 RepID=A0A922L2K4_DERFA|nr:hypothetical protein DERF_013706 [Dermatophagoides farinae]